VPCFSVLPTDIHFARHALILDTNILVAAFLPSDTRHCDARTLLQELDFEFLVPFCVVVEMWGFLCGSRKRRDYALSCLSWLSSPGNAVLFPESDELFRRSRRLTDKLQVDLVDALLAWIATEVTKRCRIKPAMRIATYDKKDFLACVRQPELTFRLFDPETLEDQY